MSSVNHGLVHLETGSVLVRHVYDLSVTPHAQWAPGTLVSWTGSNSGVITFDSGVTPTRLRLYVDVGSSPPSQGDTINDGISTSCTINALAATSPPNYSTALTGATVMKFSAGAGPIYNVSAANQTADSFELTSPFAESDGFLETTYSIHTGWTSLGFPIIDQGDRDAPGVISEGFAEAHRRLKFYGARLTYSGATPLSLGLVAVRVPFGQVIFDGAGAEQWANSDVTSDDTLLMIDGVTRVAFSFAFVTTALVSDVVVSLALARVGLGQVWEWSFATTGTQSHQGGAYFETTVVAGNVFEMTARASSALGATLTAGDILWNVRALELD